MKTEEQQCVQSPRCQGELIRPLLMVPFRLVRVAAGRARVGGYYPGSLWWHRSGLSIFGLNLGSATSYLSDLGQVLNLPYSQFLHLKNGDEYSIYFMGLL